MNISTLKISQGLRLHDEIGYAKNKPIVTSE